MFCLAKSVAKPNSNEKIKMDTKTTSPFGAWNSKVSADLVVEKSIQLREVSTDSDLIYWSELRPDEGGRTTIVRRLEDGSTEDLLPTPFNCSSRVHEYGGGSFGVFSEQIFFTNFSDQQIYRFAPGDAPVQLTHNKNARFADFSFDASRNRLFAIRELHGSDGVTNQICSVDLDSGDVTMHVEGEDFYAAPSISPDGKKLAWMTWSHPQMPWDGCEIFVADIEGNSLSSITCIAGDLDEAAVQPRWASNRRLYFLTDRSGWWNLHYFQEGTITSAYEKSADFTGPHWVFAQKDYLPLSETQLICSYTEDGHSFLADLDVDGQKLTPLEKKYSLVDSLQKTKNGICFLSGTDQTPLSLIQIDLETKKEPSVLRTTTQVKLAENDISVPQPIEFPTTGNRNAHAWFYPPANANVNGPNDEKPPLIVICHGGPTGFSTNLFRTSAQFWTNRGFALVDVNYGGSSGFGREFRDRLQGQWGIVDIDDCCAAVDYLAEQKLINPDRVAIRGGSAGGYTTLAALTFRDVFKAGASYFGVSDLEALAKETHKFESRYLDGLIGPYPESKDIYFERSPINYTEKLSCPVIFFQGLDDKVVPANQAELMYRKLKDKGIPTEYVAFEGEGHGFKKAENIKTSLLRELAFYQKAFGIEG